MKIVLIGSGNVATHMSVAFNKSGHDIIQIYSRSLSNAQLLVSKLNAENRVSTEPLSDLKHIDRNADLYIFALKDDAIPDVIQKMPLTKGVWVHTAGSLPIDLLSIHELGYGVIYPLQTFSKERELNFSEIPLFIEGNSSKTVTFLENIANDISEHIHHFSSDKRRYLHLSAVFANNFSNHMFTLASEILVKENIPFDILKPLITETAAKIMEMSPLKAQTGPAVRFDEKVMQKHLGLIDEPQLKEIYRLLSKSIHNRVFGG